jgi:methionyl-tRNA formyltransferase
MGAQAVVDVLGDWDAKLAAATPQNEALVTKAPKLKKEDGVLRFDLSAEEAYTRWRAYGDTIGVWAWLADRKLRVRFVSLSLAPTTTGTTTTTASAPAGQLSYAKERKMLCIACGEGALYSSAVQVAGRAQQSAQEFANGYLRGGTTLQLSKEEAVPIKG